MRLSLLVSPLFVPLFVPLCVAGCAVASLAPDGPATPAAAAPPPIQLVRPEGEPLPPPPWGPTGTWYLNAGGARVRVTLSCVASGACTGSLVEELSGALEPLDAITFDKATSRLRFRHANASAVSWFHADIVDGVLRGRFSQAPIDGTNTGTTDTAEPTDAAAYARHVTGWKAESFDHDLAPRVYDLLVGGSDHVRLRIDRSPANPKQFVARFKVYATVSMGAGGEGDEHDATVETWDGRHLGFTVADAKSTRVFAGAVDGRRLTGTFAQLGDPLQHDFTGVRAEVLGHGFSGKSPEARAHWQGHLRRQLEALMMGGNPAPLSREVTVLADGVAPLASHKPPVNRDDGDLAAHVQGYTLRELQFDYRIPDPVVPGASLERRAHGYLAVPVQAPPPGGFPAVLSLNGHTGSARQTLDPDNEWFWYGDSFARRGFVVLAIDIGHRPLADRHGLYPGYENGDDTEGGNGTHPAIQSPGLDSDWEEDGERAWDAMRGLDYLVEQSNVDKSRLTVAGLSMGGELTTFVAALDPRVGMAVPAGFSPDISVLWHHGSHGCWQWLHGDVTEYIDTSDLHTAIAPRPLVVETGIEDWTYSWLAMPFAGDKQVMRRTRAEYADHPERVMHYLHYDIHHFHMGDAIPGSLREPEVRVPALIAPASHGELAWQRDPTTVSTGMTLFDVIERLLPAAPSPH